MVSITRFGAQERTFNPNLRWEKGKNWNIGLDWTLFGGKLFGSFNYYNRKQQDLLGDYKVSIPPYLFDQTFVNVGTMRNSGFEFDITWNAVKTKDVQLLLNVIGRYNEQQVLLALATTTLRDKTIMT